MASYGEKTPILFINYTEINSSTTFFPPPSNRSGCWKILDSRWKVSFHTTVIFMPGNALEHFSLYATFDFDFLSLDLPTTTHISTRSTDWETALRNEHTNKINSLCSWSSPMQKIQNILQISLLLCISILIRLKHSVWFFLTTVLYDTVWWKKCSVFFILRYARALFRVATAPFQWRQQNFTMQQKT